MTRRARALRAALLCTALTAAQAGTAQTMGAGRRTTATAQITGAGTGRRTAATAQIADTGACTAATAQIADTGGRATATARNTGANGNAPVLVAVAPESPADSTGGTNSARTENPVTLADDANSADRTSPAASANPPDSSRGENSSDSTDSKNPAGAASPFALSLWREVALLGAGAGVMAAQLVIEPGYARWHGERYDLGGVNRFDRLVTNGYSKRLDYAGWAVMAAALAMPAAAYVTAPGDWKEITVMYAEAALLAHGTKELGKDLADRKRPYMYHASKPDAVLHGGRDWHNSFPSGHTTMAFTGAAFASYVYGAYHPDSPSRWLVTAAGYSLAAGTAALRLASGNHFLTDTMAGAALGTLFGVGVPWLHRQRAAHPGDKILAGLTLLPGGVGFSMRL